MERGEENEEGNSEGRRVRNDKTDTKMGRRRKQNITTRGMRSEAGAKRRSAFRNIFGFTHSGQFSSQKHDIGREVNAMTDHLAGRGGEPSDSSSRRLAC